MICHVLHVLSPSPPFPPFSLPFASSFSTTLAFPLSLSHTLSRAYAHTNTLSIHQIVKNWDPQYGDRGTLLVIIGVHMNVKEVKAALDNALVDPFGEVKKVLSRGWL